jgi:hypothetical protein
MKLLKVVCVVVFASAPIGIGSSRTAEQLAEPHSARVALSMNTAIAGPRRSQRAPRPVHLDDRAIAYAKAHAPQATLVDRKAVARQFGTSADDAIRRNARLRAALHALGFEEAHFAAADENKAVRLATGGRIFLLISGRSAFALGNVTHVAIHDVARGNTAVLMYEEDGWWLHGKVDPVMLTVLINHAGTVDLGRYGVAKSSQSSEFEPAAPSPLCKSTEQTLFSCGALRNVLAAAKRNADTNLREGTQLALCASRGLSKQAGRLIYRYGKPGAIVLEYPQGDIIPAKAFRYAHTEESIGGARGGSEVTAHLEFSLGDVSYRLDESSSMQAADISIQITLSTALPGQEQRSAQDCVRPRGAISELAHLFPEAAAENK